MIHAVWFLPDNPLFGLVLSGIFWPIWTSFVWYLSGIFGQRTSPLLLSGIFGPFWTSFPVFSVLFGLFCPVFFQENGLLSGIFQQIWTRPQNRPVMIILRVSQVGKSRPLCISTNNTHLYCRNSTWPWPPYTFPSLAFVCTKRMLHSWQVDKLDSHPKKKTLMKVLFTNFLQKFWPKDTRYL